MQIPAALASPNLAARATDQRALTAAGTLPTAAGLAGVPLAPTVAPYLSTLLLGLGQGYTSTVGLTQFVVRTRTSADTAGPAAMARMCGYLLAATGPLRGGAVHGAAGSWSPPLTLLLPLAVPQLLAGVPAGRSRYVREPHAPDPLADERPGCERPATGTPTGVGCDVPRLP